MEHIPPSYIIISHDKLTIRKVSLDIPNVEFIKWIDGAANGDVFLVYNRTLCRKEVVKVWHENKLSGKLNKN